MEVRSTFSSLGGGGGGRGGVVRGWGRRGEALVRAGRGGWGVGGGRGVEGPLEVYIYSI